ncbi:hypothetical protein AVEN_188958-1 [Araneus ventricosus]|uniref:Uncharacterized protein n=1 Tax=Araneus ventricosus TaxID=182803 RepID=A0A4Y2IL61_ARAVE|nr:hypothetical protein AVEN_188958-1 [Araneus ventricosus]
MKDSRAGSPVKGGNSAYPILMEGSNTQRRSEIVPKLIKNDEVATSWFKITTSQARRTSAAWWSESRSESFDSNPLHYQWPSGLRHGMAEEHESEEEGHVFFPQALLLTNAINGSILVPPVGLGDVTFSAR